MRGGGQTGWYKLPSFSENNFWRHPLIRDEENSGIYKQIVLGGMKYNMIMAFTTVAFYLIRFPDPLGKFQLANLATFYYILKVFVALATNKSLES